MKQLLWLSEKDILKTGICEFSESVRIVEEAFRLFDAGNALIVEESALRMNDDESDSAYYCLPAYVGGTISVCGLKWSSHGVGTDDAEKTKSRIQAEILLNDAKNGTPICVMNGTKIGAARTGAVTVLALKAFAPQQVKKAALCGAGGQAEYQLKALLYALPGLSEIAVWSRSGEKNRMLTKKYAEFTDVKLRAVESLESATKGADVIIGATSAQTPYLKEEHLKDAALYCHIGFHEITRQAVSLFQNVFVDTWEEGKNVSGQSLFRYYRDGSIDEKAITGTLGAVVSGRISAGRATQNNKIMFDAFGLPIFDLSLAKEAYRKATLMEIGTTIDW